jgi:tungstate transport system permease protein
MGGRMIDSLVQAVRLLASGDREVYFIAWTSLWMSIASVALAAVISLPLGFLLGLAEFRAKRLIVAVLNTFMALPTVVVGLLVYAFLSRSGPLGFLGLLFSPPAVIVGQTVLCLPLIASLVYSALSRTDRRLPETLVTLGASRRQVFWMTLREARVAILSALLAGFGRLIGEVGVSMMLGGNIRWYTRTLTTAIALETSKGEFELGLALGAILMIIAFLVNAGLHGVVRHGD